MPDILVSSRSFGQVSAIGQEILEGAGLSVRRVSSEDRPLDAEKLERIVGKAKPDVLLAGAEPVPRAVLAAAPKLRMVQKHGVGVDNIDLGAATELGIAVGNAPGTNNRAVADLTIGFMLNLLRSIVPAAVSTKAGGWERFIGHELGEATVGVIGTGRIGREVIQRLKGFGSSILAYDAYPDASYADAQGFQYVSLEELLSVSDVITLHVPLMDETRNLIGRSELERMKPSAVLVNIARGELIDEAALAEWLSGRRIAGAAIDVFATEPPQASPLLKLENVIATPHIGAYTHEAMDAMSRSCAETILGVLSGGRPANVLNPEVLSRGDRT